MRTHDTGELGSVITSPDECSAVFDKDGGFIEVRVRFTLADWAKLFESSGRFDSALGHRVTYAAVSSIPTGDDL